MFFVLALTSAFKFFTVWRLNLTAALESRFFIGMAAALFISFLLDRYLLYWSREAIIDELLKSGFDAVRSRALAFAPSPLMIWLFGAPYIQSHINRMIKKKGLNSYKKPTAARVRKNAPPSKKPEPSPQPDSS
jgi:hypothetical protein